MAKYKVEISDNYSRMVEIEADSEDEAREIAWEMEWVTMNVEDQMREVYLEGEV